MSGARKRVESDERQPGESEKHWRRRMRNKYGGTLSAQLEPGEKTGRLFWVLGAGLTVGIVSALFTAAFFQGSQEQIFDFIWRYFVLPSFLLGVVIVRQTFSLWYEDSFVVTTDREDPANVEQAPILDTLAGGFFGAIIFCTISSAPLVLVNQYYGEQSAFKRVGTIVERNPAGENDFFHHVAVREEGSDKIFLYFIDDPAEWSRAQVGVRSDFHFLRGSLGFVYR